jgi:hypothetical protein
MAEPKFDDFYAFEFCPSSFAPPLERMVVATLQMITVENRPVLATLRFLFAKIGVDECYGDLTSTDFPQTASSVPKYSRE